MGGSRIAAARLFQRIPGKMAGDGGQQLHVLAQGGLGLLAHLAFRGLDIAQGAVGNGRGRQAHGLLASCRAWKAKDNASWAVA